ncbi:transcription factor bHLH18-like [Andrographis paniculata]|uniref:transcription factor bHLH18-like n=1 Tax=Andrographis paniculata TaxID=175694 RepID=UPI0021E9527C|nr:transcription factor bHLH18-like [Andrographis paniculata]
MGMDDSIFTDQCEFMDSFNEDPMAAILQQELYDSNALSAGGGSPSYDTPINVLETCNSLHKSPSHKLQKTNDSPNFSTIQPNNSSAPMILNFSKSTEKPSQLNSGVRPLNSDEEAAVSEALRSHGEFLDSDEQLLVTRAQTVKKPSRVRPASQIYDHIVAERKRRQQLSQHFFTLSTLIPGLKKMDKTSVLEDGIKYLKHLQERVKTLEEQATTQTEESAVLIRKSLMTAEDEWWFDEQPLPEIEARASSNQLLIRVHCRRRMGILVKLLSAVDALSLTVVCKNAVPFGNLALDVTIVAQMDKEFKLTVQEVVKRIQDALRY